jgi:hypothetical protein
MSSRRELERRRLVLLERCAVQRSRMSSEAAPIVAAGRSIDRGMDQLRRFVTQPAVMVVGLAAFILAGRSRSLRSIGKMTALVSGAWRAGSILVAAAQRLRPLGAAPIVAATPTRGNHATEGRNVG